MLSSVVPGVPFWFNSIFFQVSMTMLDFLSTCTNQFYIALKISCQRRHQNMFIYKCLNWNKLIIFQFYTHVEIYKYENIFNSLLVAIGGSNDIYICLDGQWALETLCLPVLAQINGCSRYFYPRLKKITFLNKEILYLTFHISGYIYSQIIVFFGYVQLLNLHRCQIKIKILNMDYFIILFLLNIQTCFTTGVIIYCNSKKNRHRFLNVIQARKTCPKDTVNLYFVLHCMMPQRMGLESTTAAL